MPVNSSLSRKNFDRFIWMRDNGHRDFVTKADRCDKFFRGEQWEAATLARLSDQRRPALTINKIISTISNVMGEQIYNRAEISFRPRSGAPAATAEILSKVFKHVSDNNQLDWKRSDMFADGIITSRGFLDMRMSFDDTLSGDITISNINPKNVLIDPDADQMDPDTWNDLIITKWVTADLIEQLYSKEDAEILRRRTGSAVMDSGYDSVDYRRDRFGGDTRNYIPFGGQADDHSGVTKNIRLIERQYRVLDNQEHFVEYETGDMRPIPKEFDRDRIAMFVERFGFGVMKKKVSRIKWEVTADDVVLHDKWSPYKHFTIIPYFPYFRHGHTVGLVENLTGPQELLNKVSSQELHVINTTANSGYKIKTGALQNMTVAELEERGSETGLVIEVNGDPDKDIVKITPNTIPTGLERVSYKAEESIKSISGISDSQMGQDRADVAAKAIQAKRQAGSTNLAKPLDSLTRTDWILARNAIDLIQTYYTEPRILNITHNQLTGDTEKVQINEMSPEGEVVNDLTIGEYDVVISSVPVRETLEDSQFDQAVALRELGIAIPDNILIENSRLNNKADILKQMNAQANSPEAQEQAQLAKDSQKAEIEKTRAETGAKIADTSLKTAKGQKETIAAQKDAAAPPEDNGADAAMMKAQAEMQVMQQKHDLEMKLAQEKAAFDENSRQRDEARKDKESAAGIVADRVAALTAAEEGDESKPANPPKENA